MGGLGIIVLVLMLSFVYPYFRPHKKGTMPSNLGLIQQRCVKKIMEHVDAKTASKDIDNPGKSVFVIGVCFYNEFKLYWF